MAIYMGGKAIATESKDGSDANVTAANVTNALGYLPPSMATVLNAIYPVGSIYMSVSSTSPRTLFGGTWERIQDKFLLAAGSSYAAGATGGEATHTLTKNEMPAHDHSVKFGGGDADSTIVAGRAYVQSTKWWWSDASDAITQKVGDGAAHNNMPPYLAVYIWKRTA